MSKDDFLSPAEFYNMLVNEYDRMTRFTIRLEAQRSTITELIDRFDVHKAIELACGTGLYSILLAQEGVDVHGADISPEMVDQARRNAAELGLDIPFSTADMLDLPHSLPAANDTVLCLGNSIPHIPTAKLANAMQSISQLLTPGGHVILQLLNYERVLSQHDRFISANRHDDTELVRFYDFVGGTLRFNILTMRWQKEKVVEHKLNTTTLYSHCFSDFQEAMAQAGLTDTRAFGDLKFNAFDPETSRDLVVVATR